MATSSASPPRHLASLAISPGSTLCNPEGYTIYQRRQPPPSPSQFSGSLPGGERELTAASRALDAMTTGVTTFGRPARVVARFNLPPSPPPPSSPGPNRTWSISRRSLRPLRFFVFSASPSFPASRCSREPIFPRRNRFYRTTEYRISSRLTTGGGSAVHQANYFFFTLALFLHPSSFPPTFFSTPAQKRSPSTFDPLSRLDANARRIDGKPFEPR